MQTFRRMKLHKQQNQRYGNNLKRTNLMVVLFLRCSFIWDIVTYIYFFSELCCRMCLIFPFCFHLLIHWYWLLFNFRYCSKIIALHMFALELIVWQLILFSHSIKKAKLCLSLRMRALVWHLLKCTYCKKSQCNSCELFHLSTKSRDHH